MKYGIFNKPIVTIYETDRPVKQTPEGEVSTISDEGLYGNTCKILAGPGGLNRAGDPLNPDMVEIITSYGYCGYAYVQDMQLASEAKLRSWLHGKFAMVSRNADVFAQPKVSAIRLMSLTRGNVVEKLPERSAELETQTHTSTLPLQVEGWQRIRLVDERVGYMRTTSLRAKLFCRSSVFYFDGDRSCNEALAMARGIAPEQIVQHTLATYFEGNEDLLRAKIIETALAYLGTEYRWGGKTLAGIDCSGLVSTAYLQNGIMIYRDAKMLEGWPVKEIDRAAIKPADLLYFPGHVALYLGQGRYLHSTSAAASGGVVVNSLLPNDPLYRQDLFDSMTACGSIF